MSTAPQTAPPSANKSMVPLAAVLVGVVVLCSGLLGMALVSSYALERGHEYAVKPAAPSGTSSKTTTPKAKPTDSTNENPGPKEVAYRFLDALKVGQYENAYRLASSQMQSEEGTQSDFEERVSKMPVLRGHRTAQLEMPTGRISGKVTIRVYVKGPKDQSARFNMDVTEENDGSWKVNSFDTN